MQTPNRGTQPRVHPLGAGCQRPQIVAMSGTRHATRRGGVLVVVLERAGDGVPPPSSAPRERSARHRKLRAAPLDAMGSTSVPARGSSKTSARERFRKGGSTICGQVSVLVWLNLVRAMRTPQTLAVLAAPAVVTIVLVLLQQLANVVVAHEGESRAAHGPGQFLPSMLTRPARSAVPAGHAHWRCA